MKKMFLFFLLLIYIQPFACSATMEGGVSKIGENKINKIIDSSTNMPVSGADIIIPKSNYMTTTDENGAFALDVKINGDTIMSVEKDGYRPFSLTLDDNTTQHPMVVAIEKSNVEDILITSELYHLGDNSYSNSSANSAEFRKEATGPYFAKNFTFSNSYLNKSTYLVIGSIIGIDTLLAKKMGQNQVTNSYASPPEVYFNGVKISEIHLNGDGQKIKIPNNLISRNSNEIMIKTGKNLLQMAYIDYDDIELMNLYVKSE
ncbi:MAG: hypothetical protein R3Y28_04675 [Candidatus Gastranaerophilales bacterium]